MINHAPDPALLFKAETLAVSLEPGELRIEKA